jgi:CheY-like chemotaxis protein
MPGLSGWEVLKRLKSDPDLRRIPVVVVSVVAGEGRGSLLGAVDLVTKPFDREDLLRVLWRHLGRTRSGRILMITEEDELRERLEHLLGDRGLEVITRGGKGNPFDAMAQEAPDALVFDLATPGIDGLDFLGSVRMSRHYGGLPIFAVMDHGLEEDARDRLNALHTVIVPRAEPTQALEEVLGVLFPAADTAEKAG